MLNRKASQKLETKRETRGSHFFTRKVRKDSFDLLLESSWSERIIKVKTKFLRRKLRRQIWDALAAELDYRAYALCALWNINRRALIRAFRKDFGSSPQAFFECIRDRHARALVGEGVRKKEIVERLGFKHASHLSRRLKSPVNGPPDVLQKAHRTVPQG